VIFKFLYGDGVCSCPVSYYTFSVFCNLNVQRRRPQWFSMLYHVYVVVLCLAVYRSSVFIDKYQISDVHWNLLLKKKLQDKEFCCKNEGGATFRWTTTEGSPSDMAHRGLLRLWSEKVTKRERIVLGARDRHFHSVWSTYDRLRLPSCTDLLPAMQHSCMPLCWTADVCPCLQERENIQRQTTKLFVWTESGVDPSTLTSVEKRRTYISRVKMQNGSSGRFCCMDTWTFLCSRSLLRKTP
jgi:hypothetical protein